jgi:hypothetical protein
MHLGQYPEKIISFQWDKLYDTAAGLPKTLASDIGDDIDRPIIADVTTAGGGLYVYGYNLSNTSLTMTYCDAQWNLRSKAWATSDGWVDVSYNEGRSVPKLPQRRFVPFTSAMASGFIAYLNAARNGKTNNHTYNWDY